MDDLSSKNESIAVVKDNQAAQKASLHQAAPSSIPGVKDPHFSAIGDKAMQGAKTK